MKVIQPPSLLLTIVNHKVLESPHAHGMTFSLAYGVMNHRDGRTRLALAGSVPVILCRNNGDIQVFESDSAPVGQTAVTRYDDHEFVLQAGDRLLMLTHGLMRILNKTSPSVLNTLSGLMKLSTLEPLDAVYNTLQHWLDTLGVSTDTEDLTLLLLERSAP
ncbi:MAG: SpoIIE family protein phosphatase [Limnobacter sp.]|uniref:SpoIIE family protein phosphatase n=1 Tax=Limnobacter sp. TaxID=2003368 RepID=UPI0039194BBE